MSNKKLLKFNSKVVTKINNSTVNSFNGAAVSCGVSPSIPPQPIVGGYLTFSKADSFTLATGDNAKHWNGTIEYSTDTTNWAVWDGTTTLSSANNGTTNILYVRGTGNTYIISDSTTNTEYRWVVGATKISGNIENLLDYQTVSLGNQPTMTNYCFACLFYSNSIIDAGDLVIPRVSSYSCYSMFNNCTSLTVAPELPATTLANNCYDQMFYNCTSLTVAPELPATVLPNECYKNMFMFSNITTAQSLLAETIYGNAVVKMFEEDMMGTADNFKVNDVYLYNVKELKSSTGNKPSLDRIAKNVHFGTTLTTIENDGVGGISSTLPSLYFHFTDNDTVSFNLTGKFAEGTSKNTKTYNVYTDNTTIKNSALNNGAQYVTVNVYHLDGTAW